MDRSLRPCTNRQNRRQVRLASILAVFIFSGLAAAPVAISLAASQANELTTSSLARKVTPNLQETAIRTVAPGEERLSVSARLSETSGALVTDIAWRVFDQSGEKLFDDVASNPNLKLPPGDYIVEARYGAKSIRENLSLAPGKELIVNYILNVGALRVLPRIDGIASHNMASESRVFAVSGPDQGKLVWSSATPGEMILLNAGTYRVESRFAFGNAASVTDVEVKPAIMSALDIKHKVGLLRLAFTGAADATVNWTVSEQLGDTLPALEGMTAALVLKPGHYVAKVNADGKDLMTTFEIKAGAETAVTLGN